MFKLSTAHEGENEVFFFFLSDQRQGSNHFDTWEQSEHRNVFFPQELTATINEKKIAKKIKANKTKTWS